MTAIRPTLYIFSGLPAVGKSTIAQALATRIGAVYLRIDTIEQALRDLCSVQVEGEGYRLTYRIASDNLRIGASVVADSCNPIELTRREWREVAASLDAAYVDIEVTCSDAQEHRRRVRERRVDIEGLALPGWEQVLARKYDEWRDDRIVVDTAGRSAGECVRELMDRLNARAG